MNYPFKISWRSEGFVIFMLLASVVLSFYFYERFPEQVVTHWNFEGVPDGHSGRFWGAFMFPVVLIGIYALFMVLPLLDPRRERYQEFVQTYIIFRNLILTAMFVVFAAAGAYNLGYNVDINIVAPLVVGGLFIVLGNYMGKVKSNWFVGIRTPWTLSNEEVWNKTHRFGGRLFMLFGFAIIATPFFTRTWGTVVFIAGIAIVAVGSTVYSYLLYRKIQK